MFPGMMNGNMSMAGISDKKWLAILAALSSLALSCVKEEAVDPVGQGGERFEAYDPVVRFGLETYMGSSNPVTKTTYAGEDQTVIFESKRYERINWNVDPSDTKNPQDIVRIVSERDFTQDNKKFSDYKAIGSLGRTNQSDTKEDVADTDPLSGQDKDAFYWSVDANPRYFYATYPSPAVSGSRLSFNPDTDLDGTAHKLTVSGEIPSTQPYAYVKDASGVREYMPDMRNAFMYAAALMPGGDAGYKKVPLRFKPLFSAVKLLVTASSAAGDAQAKKYRLTQVELRTDINYNDVYLRPFPLGTGPGTALGGKFKASFGPAAPDADGVAATGDFTLLSGQPTDTSRRLRIPIPEGDRICLGNNTVKLTFLALPVDQKYMTVDYTFECLEDQTLDPTDPSVWANPANKRRTIRRTLALQNRNKIMAVDDDAWFQLDKAHKLYVRSGVPAIEYVFQVEAQSFFPRAWSASSTKASAADPASAVNPAIFLAEDFYSVVSYRDSSGVLQPLKWQVTGYSSDPTGEFSLANKPGWLALRGDDGSYNPAQDKAVFFDPEQTSHAEYGYANNGINPAGDPWAVAWGYGTRMDDATKKYHADDGFFCGYGGFKYGHSYAFYHGGATNNGNYTAKWSDPPSYNYCDQDGNYYYTEDQGVHKKDESFAYDLSSHDILGHLTAPKNGDIGTTANCYIVSAPGWYRFPAVYGNAYKGGSVNSKAYTGVGGSNLLGAFLDHDNQPITDPWIQGITEGPSGVSLVWEDAEDIVYAGKFTADTDRADKQKAFYWKDPATGHGYIYFFVNQVSFSNAVIAAKSGSTTVWSWHIWGVPDPVRTLETVEIEPNKKFGKDPEPFLHTLSQTRKTSPGNYPTNDPFVYKSKHYATTGVWKERDLGQGEKEETSVDYRPPVYVEFTQYWRGKPIARRVLCLAQSGVNDKSDNTIVPAYQWGRKDPFYGTKGAYSPRASASGSSIGQTIRNPDVFYHGNYSLASQGKNRYDNLWNANVNYTVNTFMKFDLTDPYSGNGGRRDLPVEKTIYDPCPPGYVMPNLFAFTAFNSRGLFQTRILMDKVAISPNGTKPNGYYNFAASYNESNEYHRKVGSGNPYARFYMRGRRNGNNNEGKHDQDGFGFYWLAEPASDKSSNNTGAWSYGSSWFFQTHESGKEAQVYPVCGGESVSEGNVVSDAKWQRTHGIYIRPMIDRTPISSTP